MKARRLSWDDLKKGTPYFEGKSKRVYKIDEGRCLITLIPTLSSFTYNRHEVVPKTAEIRLDVYELAVKRLQAESVPTAFIERVDKITYIAKLCSNPPFETIVKNFAVGSTLRKYPGLFPEMYPFKPPVVKFDYRTAPEDQPIAADYIRAKNCNPDEFKRLALRTNEALQAWLSPLILVDFCLIFGRTLDEELVITSEISPDGMRLRSADGKSYDKDLFRHGKSGEEIVQSWKELLELLRN